VALPAGIASLTIAFTFFAIQPPHPKTGLDLFYLQEVEFHRRLAAKE